MIKEFNLKFRIELQWPFTFKKTDEEDQPHIPGVSEIQVSSTHHGVSTTQQIKIDPDGVRLTKQSGYTKPDKRYRGYWENKEATESGNRPVSKRPHEHRVYRKGTNYYKTIELTHEGLTEAQIAQKLNISRSRVSQLWSDYTKISSTPKTRRPSSLPKSTSQPKQKRYTKTRYDKKFRIEAVSQALDTSRTEVCKLYNLPESTLRHWIAGTRSRIYESSEPSRRSQPPGTE